MREYAKVSPKFWQGGTGKEVRRRGSSAVVVALYLMSSPHSNMLGLYSQPMLYMAHETGLGVEGATEGLAHCIDAGFCAFDQGDEFVWVYEMASYQIASELKASDNRCLGIQKDYDALQNNPYLGPFYDRYAAVFHMTNRREFVPRTPLPQLSLIAPPQAPSQDPPKPRAGAGAGTSSGARAGKPSASSPAKLPTCPTAEIIALYHEILPNLPKAVLPTKDRVKALRRTWEWVLTSHKGDGERRAETPAEALEWFRSYFTRATENDFLMGRTPRTGEHANWRCDLDFLLTDRGMKHVIEKTVTEAA